MDIPTLRAFFMWCTILDVAFLIFAFLIISFASDTIYEIRSSFFPISRETFDTANYGWLGLLKIFIVVFNLVPWIALKIIDKAM